MYYNHFSIQGFLSLTHLFITNYMSGSDYTAKESKTQKHRHYTLLLSGWMLRRSATGEPNLGPFLVPAPPLPHQQLCPYSPIRWGGWLILWMKRAGFERLRDLPEVVRFVIHETGPSCGHSLWFSRDWGVSPEMGFLVLRKLGCYTLYQSQAL